MSSNFMIFLSIWKGMVLHEIVLLEAIEPGHESSTSWEFFEVSELLGQTDSQ